MIENPITPQSIIRDCPRMSLDESFAFRCDPSVDCFTNCCRDVAIVLTPYDVLRMKQALHLDSSEFLLQYTLSPFTQEQKIPAVILRMDPETKRCPFVGENGCGVYVDRPWACRMYPLGLAQPDKATPADRTFHFLVREELCHGHNTQQKLSVRDWIAQQGVEEYDMMGASFAELMLHPSWEQEEFLTPEHVGMFYMACYDIDRFRRFVFETRFLQLFVVDETRVEVMQKDDLELLDFGIQWLRFCLFHEPSMKVKRSVVVAADETVERTPQGIYG